MADVQFTTTPFDHSAPIPREYTCDGEDVSPPLSWTAPPEQTESLTLIVNDPDAPVPGAFTHWVLFNLPPSVTDVPRAYHAGDPRVEGTALEPKEGMNDFGDVGYGGPCPPGGEEHRYIFTLYAVRTILNLDSGADVGDVEAALDDNVLATAEHVGTYQRG